MSNIPSRRGGALLLRFLLVMVAICTGVFSKDTQFELEFYRPNNPDDRIPISFKLSSRSVNAIAPNASRSVHVVICPTDGLSTVSSIDRHQSESSGDRVQITRIACQRESWSPDMLLLSRLQASLVVYVPRNDNKSQKQRDSSVASVMAHNSNRTVVRLNLNSQDRLYRWLLSSQPLFARWGQRLGGHGKGPDSVPTRPPNNTVVNLLRQLSASQAHSDRNHVTTVMIYVLLIFFTLFVLTGILGLGGYLLQRLRHVHIKRRCSRHLILATRKALKKLPLRTLRSSDMEVSSGCDQCAVCIELYKASDVIRILPCRHFYHKKCIDPWLLEQRSCPLCKLDILKSCGILLGLSAEDESYLATRLVEQDSDSLSSSISSVPVFSYPLGWRIKRFVTSILGKPDSSHSDCEACSRAYLQAMQLNALRCGGDMPYGSWSAHLRTNTPQTAQLSWGTTMPRSMRAEYQSDNQPTATGSLVSWICSCLCWWRMNLKLDDPILLYPHSCRHRTAACHLSRPRLDADPSQALHAARLLCYRSSNSVDQLCTYHASVMGLQSANMHCTPYTAHWTQYATHHAALRQHLSQSRVCVSQESRLSAPHSSWRLRFGLRGSQTSCNPLSTEQSHWKRHGPCFGSKNTVTPPVWPDQTCPPLPTATTYLSAGKSVAHTHSADALMTGKTEQAIVIHHITDDNSPSSDQCAANSDAWIKSAGISTRICAHSGSQHPFHATDKLNERKRLSTLPPISVVGTQSSSSSDGSSEPSLVVLPLSSVQGCADRLGTFWSELHDSTMHIAPPSYLESVFQSPNSTVDLDGAGYGRSHAKIRSRKFRGGYHPYYFPGTGRRAPVRMHSESKNCHSTITRQGCDKVNRKAPFRIPFTASVVRSDRLLGRLSKLFCTRHSSDPSRDTPDPSRASYADSVKSPSANLVVNPPPPYLEAAVVLPNHVTSTHTNRSPLVQPQTGSVLPQPNITCPLCRVELRQIIQHMHDHSRCGPTWRRMFHVHSFKRTDNGSVAFNQFDRSSQKHRHYHRRHVHQQQRRKTPTDSTTAVHVHSYELHNFQPHPTTPDGIQPVNSDCSDTNVETTMMNSARLQGVRVTVEPPEVQYHNGPLTSDSSSSPADSYHADDCSSNSVISRSSTQQSQHHVATDHTPIPSCQ